MNQDVVFFSKEARLALLAMQYMTKPEYKDIPAARYAQTYEQVYFEMLRATPAPQN